MFGECHAHLIMDGENYRKAVAVHANGVQEEDLRTKLAGYAARGICFVRDGGDSHGISARALQLAGEYGITYRTPLFAIHKRGHYGGIVGFPFDTWKEYEQLVGRVRAEGGHFIKIMCSGILDFRRRGALGTAGRAGGYPGDDSHCTRGGLFRDGACEWSEGGA